MAHTVLLRLLSALRAHSAPEARAKAALCVPLVFPDLTTLHDGSTGGGLTKGHLGDDVGIAHLLAAVQTDSVAVFGGMLRCVATRRGLLLQWS